MRHADGQYGNTSALALQSADRDMKEFEKLINKNHLLTKFLAESLASGGLVENAIKSSTSSSEVASASAVSDDDEQFVEAKRMAVKAVTKCNIDNLHSTQAYMESIREVCQQIDSDEGQDTNEKNYEDIVIQTLGEKKNNQPNTDIESHNYMQEVRSSLGEKRSRGDDDVEVVHQHGTDQETSLKCPITSQFFERPMKNKVCSHTYDYDGIVHYLKTKRQCPIFGCGNEHVKMNELEEDEEMLMKISRFKSRQKNSANAVYSQVVDDDNDE